VIKSELKTILNRNILTLPTKISLLKTVNHWRSNGETIALIPTMGALHAGHLSLVETEIKHCDRTIVSIFVNPTQFGPDEDFKQYPRNETIDIEALEGIGTDTVYIPKVTEMYDIDYDNKYFSTTAKISG